MNRPVTRVGHIGYEDARFCGRSVFADLLPQCRDLADAFGLALGLRVDDDAREVLRWIAVVMSSPDARVWPLKMTRVLASRGSAVAGAFGGLLLSNSQTMGPGAATRAAQALEWIGARVDDPDDATKVDAATAQFLDSNVRINGFGVPFRKEDERRLALLARLGGHAVTRRRFFRLHLRVGDAVRALRQTPPNVVLSIAALLLDLGLPAGRAGMAMAVLMSHNFVAHAIESSECDRELLTSLPVSRIEYRGTAARKSPRATEHELRPALIPRHTPS